MTCDISETEKISYIGRYLPRHVKKQRFCRFYFAASDVDVCGVLFPHKLTSGDDKLLSHANLLPE